MRIKRIAAPAVSVAFALVCTLLAIAFAPAAYSQGAPTLSATIASQKVQSGAYLVELRLTNPGTGLARNVRINAITFRTLTGTGATTLVSAQTTLPAIAGDIPAGGSSTVQIFVTFPATVARFSMTENGTLQNVAGSNLSFSLAQSIIPPANKAPIVDPGPAQTITLPSGATLTGTVSDDGFPLGSSLSFKWTANGPGNVNFGSPTSLATTAAFDQPGPYVLHLSAGDGLLNNSADVNILVNPKPPALISLTPSSGAQGKTVLDATIVGDSTHFVQGSTQVSLGDGIHATNIRVDSSTSLRTDLVIDTDAVLGIRTLTVTNGSELVPPLPNAFNVLAGTDNIPPVITLISPANGSNVFTAVVTIKGTATDDSGVAEVTCAGSAATLTPPNFSCDVPLVSGPNSIEIKATDVPGNSSTKTLALTYNPVPKVTITFPPNLSYTSITPTTVNGTVDQAAATVTVNSISAPVVSGQFSMALPLAEGPNIVTASASSGLATGTASIEVTLDMTPPHVTITSPPDKFITDGAAITVVGNINDIVVGTVNDQQASVAVNGTAAQVSNRTFLLTDLPLAMGANVIQAVGRDRVGNFATTQITVTRQPPAAQPVIHLISGNNQTGIIGSDLPSPLVISLTDASGNPVASKPVIFKVTQDDGLVSAAGGVPAPTVIATTNSSGQAQVALKLGMRAGAGGNTVEAYSVGFGGTAIFNATGNPGPAGKIVVDSGNDQLGPIGQDLPKPLIVAVVDPGNNRLVGIPVTFSVTSGGGALKGLEGLATPVAFTTTQTPSSASGPTVTVTTDSDGRAAVTLTLGTQEGNANNLVEANFPGNTTFPAAFTASGRFAGDPAKTLISGVVLDNSNVPVPGVTLRAMSTTALHSTAATVPAAPGYQTDAQGQFTIPQAPVGFVKLLVDGSTSSLPGPYPSLEYDLVTVAGQNNTVGAPIYILPLNTANSLCVTQTTGGGTLTIPEAPGFSLTFGPGQVTFPGGSKTGCVSVTTVHGDRIPMTPGFGQQPRFIVTIQPAGATFNPPAPITLPNVDGLNPREVTEMYSFDHDISSFVAIGTGTVSDDGQVIRSNPGVGVLKAGWHCGGNPSPGGSAATCPTCMFCQGTTCTPQGNGTACGGGGTCQFTGQNSQPNCICPPGETLINGQCLVTGPCPQGLVFINGGCYDPDSCPPGQVVINGRCQNPCQPGQILRNGQCWTPCPNGLVLINGQCVDPDSCPPGQVKINGICQNPCPTGQVLINGQCYDPDHCPAGQVLVNGICQNPCPAGHILINNQCYDRDSCPQGQVVVNGTCQNPCPSGQVLNNGQCQNVPLSLDLFANGTADTRDDITLLNPPQPIPFSIAVHGGNGPQLIQLTVSPPNAAILDRGFLTLADGASATVVATPLTRSQIANDVVVSASINGAVVSSASFTIVDISLPQHVRTAKTPTGMPDRIPPRVPTTITISIAPDLTSSGQFVTFVPTSTGSSVGCPNDIAHTGSVDVNGPLTLLSTTDIPIQGVIQTAPGCGGSLHLAILVRGQIPLQSDGFSVAAIPTGLTEAWQNDVRGAVTPPVTGLFSALLSLVQCTVAPQFWGMKVGILPESDSGDPNDLDQVQLLELISPTANTNFQNPNDLVHITTAQDEHSMTACPVPPYALFNSLGHRFVNQVHVFFDKRTGAQNIPIQNSGYVIDNYEYVDANNNLFVDVRKVGATTTVQGITVGPGEPSSSTITTPSGPLQVTH